MRRVSLQVPVNMGEQIAQMAIECGVRQVSLSQATSFTAGRGPEVVYNVQFDCSTPIAKDFLDAVTTAPFYDPRNISISVREPRSILSSMAPSQITIPIIEPASDIYQELWQFTHVTFSFVTRVVIAALLLSYGMIFDHLLLIISGLLFLPMQTALLAIGFAAFTREWRLFRQGIYATLAAVLLIILAGAAVASISGSALQFQSFSTPGKSFLFSIIVGIAAAMASADDKGRRELIGLAVTAQVSILPAWFGISLILGFPESNLTIERIWTFFMIISTIALSAGVTYLLVGIRGDALERYISCIQGKCPGQKERGGPGRLVMP